jgi:hypothetical protein
MPTASPPYSAIIEIEPPGDVRRGRQFVDGVRGRLRGERLEASGVGSRPVGDEHPDVDPAVGRPLALGGH